MGTYNDGMKHTPPPLLLNTFRVAACLKLLGVFVALFSGYLLVGVVMVEKWLASLILGITLLLLLLPWPKRFPQQESKLVHVQLITAVILAIISPYLEMIQSAWSPFEPLMSLPLFMERLDWSVEQINSIHALGLLFVMVPVVLGSWQYSFRGMWACMGLAGSCYLAMPFLLPEDAFTWGLYAVRGFVLLGTTLIIAFIVSTLATAQRREQTAVSQANNKLADANRKLAQQTAVLEQLTISQERNRMARELHDTLAHSLSGTAIQLQAVGTLLNVNPDAAAVELAEAQQQIKSGLDESRRAIAALRATPLEELGLAEALHQRCHNLAERNGLHSNCQINDVPGLPPLTEQSIYRIADEALLNIEKYAQASEICIQLSVVSEQIVLEVRDDGVGFDVEKVQENGRFGIIGMHERAELIDGQLQIESELSKGTTVKMVVAYE